MSLKLDIKKFGKSTIVLSSMVIAGIIFVFSQYPPLRTIETRFIDLQTTFLADQRKPNPDIVVVKINEGTLANFSYRHPIDREFLANIVEKILSGNPKAIGIDILFDQKSDPKKDKRLFDLLRQNAKRVFVATASREDGLSKRQVKYQKEHLAGISKAIVVLRKDPNDGVVRHFLESRVTGDTVIPTLAHSVGETWLQKLSTGNRIISYHGDGKGGAYQYATYPAHAVAVLPQAWIKSKFVGKYVLIGVDLEDYDAYRTPFTAASGEIKGTLPGVVIHAHILDQLLAGVNITSVSDNLQRFGLYFLFAILGLIGVSLRLPIWGRVLILAGILVGLFFISHQLFEAEYFLLPAIPMAAATLLAAISGSTYMWQRDRKEKRFIRNAWSRYVSAKVVDDLIDHPEKLELGGEMMDVTFIFTDIAGFTSMTEQWDVSEFSPILNEYLDRVSAKFFEAGATIDKIVGDAVIGFIGAPISDPDHPNKAVALALAINETCNQYQEEMAERGFAFGHTRIGVHSGPAIIGNFGGSNFFDYTALGDTVNTASRLEGANKMFTSRICVSSATTERATLHSFRPLGRLLLAGKQKPVEASEPLASVCIERATSQAYLDAYQCLERSDPQALAAFQNLADKFPYDYLVEFHLERLKNGLNTPLIDLSGGSYK